MSVVVTKQAVLDALCAAIDDLNESRPPKDQLAKSSSTVLFGKDTKLDSMGFVNLILAMEGRLSAVAERPVVLTEMLMSNEGPLPPAELEAFAGYIYGLLGNGDDV